MNNVLITGGTGSWGYELTKTLLEMNYKITIFSRNECKQVDMQRHFNNPNLKFVIGDIRDKEALNTVFFNDCFDVVYHLAALKHVPVCEEYPMECIKTNVHGTANVIECCKNHSVEKMIYVSTDKAVEPNNTYGMSKALGERLMADASRKHSSTKFITVRGGNVIGTNGSVIPFFKKQIETTNVLTVTHPEMTRFFITIKEAIELLLEASKYASNGSIYVIKMNAYNIMDIARFVAYNFGNENTTIKIIGLRPKEKIHELLVSKHETRNTSEADKYFIIYPDHDKPYNKISTEEYSSDMVVVSPTSTEDFL